MTLIIGVHCQDGIVLGADSLRTYSTLIEQEVSDKIEIVGNAALIATSGEVGLSQLVKHELRAKWATIARQDSVSSARNLITNTMLRQIQPAASRAAQFNREFDGCGAVIALPFQDTPLLLSYDTIANSREVTLDSPFVSVGSASFQADPFLAFVKRTLWNDSAPTNVTLGILGVLWTLDHVSRVNAGLGVGGRSRIALLQRSSSEWRASFLQASRLENYKVSIARVEEGLQSLRSGFFPGDTESQV